ncbi:hypothetical protein [Streptomyces narbonensis]|uniref:VG15 protein n=1 Tax=Streptomyces narbonensis TaxID=67333 RepID=UPI0033F51759
MTDAELMKALMELSRAHGNALEAAGWNDDDPEAQRILKELEPVQQESIKRSDAERAAKRAAKEAETKRKKVDAAKVARERNAGSKFAPGPEDRERVLKEALKGVHRAEPGKFFEIALGGRSRKEQQAIRELAGEGFLKKVSRGHTSMLGSTREVEAYGGQGYTITPEGEERLREILAAKGEPFPQRNDTPPARKKPAATVKAVARPTAQAATALLAPPADRSRQLAEARYSQVQATSRSVVDAVQALWRDATPDRILAAMSGEMGKQILNAVIAGQLSVAQGAEAFVTGAMLSQGASASTAARLVPTQLAGMAADGRALSTLLYLPSITTSRALALGMSPEAASAMGLNQMAMLVASTITDTARTATSVAMTATPSCVSYVRVVKLPACSRCIILAGRQYSYSEGFKRHPRCDCGMEPMSDREWREADSPDDLFKAMSPEERRKRFGTAGAEAIELGADLNQVVNARRGISTTSTGKKVTTEGTTKRGIGGKSLNAGFEKAQSQRLMRAKEARQMPEQLLKSAHGNRDLQIALLKKHGYIT